MPGRAPAVGPVAGNRPAAGPTLRRQELFELRLVDDRHAVLLGGLELGLARVGAGDEVRGLLADGAGDLATRRLDRLLDVHARLRERAGDDQRLARQRPLRDS